MPRSASRGRHTDGSQVISASLSKSLTNLMEYVVTVVPSYAQRTYIKGYYVGERRYGADLDTNLDGGQGGWKVNDYNYSFYGWVGTASRTLSSAP